MTTQDLMIGKRIENIEIDGYEIRIVLEDGTCLDYSASDGGYSCWTICKKEDDGTKLLFSNSRCPLRSLFNQCSKCKIKNGEDE